MSGSFDDIIMQVLSLPETTTAIPQPRPQQYVSPQLTQEQLNMANEQARQAIAKWEYARPEPEQIPFDADQAYALRMMLEGMDNPVNAPAPTSLWDLIKGR